MNFKREDTVVTKNKGTQVEDVLSTPKRSQDMLTKAKNKFFNIGEALKTNKLLNGEVDHQKKSRTQATLDYLFKPCPHKVDRNSAIANVAHKESPKRALSLQKQNSVGAYPITIDIIRSESCEKEKSVHDDFHDFNFPAGLHEKSDEYRETAALALERPRKKLSFREPEIFVYSFKDKQRGAKKLQYSGTKTSVLRTNNLRQSSSCENIQLESQAMRVVRTVGQAFEVCHKLSINAPEAEHDEHETLTQDLLSDHISDAMSDKPKKDYIIEATSDKHSLPIEENILEDLNFNDTNKLLRIPPTDTLTSPTTTNCNRKMVSGETYASHVIDEFQTGGSGSGSMANTNVFSTGSAVSTQHEIQLLKEQLEQQSQQTQAALAQLQLVREQLATEQSARMEAQARTHQLLVHNKELLDHIAALVSHLQGGEQISAQQNTGPHVAMPQGEPVSPQPSVDRLSVTFADKKCSFRLIGPNIKHSTMEQQAPNEDGEGSEEEYSASVNAIIQRKASTRRSRRKSKRRASSPFSPDILPESLSRRNSVFTSSSGDTAISVDESIAQELTQEKLFENIKLHKEVLSNVKMQPWNMRKKLKLVVQAKNYVKKHEGALQERFTQSHSLRNMLARWYICLVRNWQHYRREMANLTNLMTPWEKRIKEIESHFGSVVASYFIFLRWLFWVNVVTAGILIAFIAVPEMVLTNVKGDAERKSILPEDKYNATNFLTMWDFDGVLKYTPLFYGWYTNHDFESGYRLPLAYFMTQLVVYIYSFVATLRKMAKNSRLSKLSEKDDECVFSWKLFTGWDYMIGNAETAHNRMMSIVMSFKEALLEEAEKKRNERNWKIIAIRVLVNIAVLALFTLSAAAVIFIVKRSTEPEANSTLWRRNETAIVMSLISFLFPMLLEFLGYMERYHPRKQLRVQLGRIMLLNLLNIYSLVIAQFDRVDGMGEELLKFKNNYTVTPAPVTADVSFNTPELITVNPIEITTKIFENCTQICIEVTKPHLNQSLLSKLIPLIATSVASTTLTAFMNNLTAITSSIPNVTTPSYFFESENLYKNDSECCEDNLYANVTLNSNLDFNSVNNNESKRNNYIDEDVLNKFNETFQDYLQYILEKFDFEVATLKNNETHTENMTSVFDYNSTDSDVFDVFKETASPVIDFPTNLNNIINEITNTVASTIDTFYNNSEMVCKEQCSKTVLRENNFGIFRNETFTNTVEIINISTLSYRDMAKLRSLCWETMFGQEIVKLTVMDLAFTVLGTLGMDFFRGVFVRVMNRCWCWDLEKKFPEYGEFKVAENILHLVNNQGMVWMGMFFSPGIVLINVTKLMIMMYLRSWTVLTCNVPHSIIFRASRSNNFYFALLLTMLFLCVLPVGYAIVWVKPSWHCGPFSTQTRVFHIFTKTIKKVVPIKLHKSLDYVVSPGIVIPLLVLLILIIYYLISLTNSLREANADLRIQLRQERTEERRKMFQFANRKKRGGSADENNPYGKWKTLLNNLPENKNLDDTSKPLFGSELKEDSTPKDVLSRFIKRALKKNLDTSELNNSNEKEVSRTENADILKKKSISGLEELPNSVFKFNPETNEIGTSRAEDHHYLSNFERQDSTATNYSKTNLSRSNSHSYSISSKDTRYDSLLSNWSDTIPAITVNESLSENLKLKDKPIEKEKALEPFGSTFIANESTTNNTERFKPIIIDFVKKKTKTIEKNIDTSPAEKEDISDESVDRSVKTVKSVTIDIDTNK